MHAIILSIGDELVLGQTIDTNSGYLSAELIALGVSTLYHQTVADDQPAIVQAIRDASQRAALVIITGGLGPTEDDLTRQALAEAMGVPLVTDEASVEAIRAFFTRRTRPMPERNKVQALHPAGTTMIENTCGTAPGIDARFGLARFFVTPGVPSEMIAMYRLHVRPQVEAMIASHVGEGSTKRRYILTEKINTFGIGESDLADKLGDLMDRKRNPLVGTTVANGIVSVRLRSEFEDAALARMELDASVAAVEQRLGALVSGRGDCTLQEALVHLLRKRALKVATAESCTGGWVGRYLTEIAGSSDVYLGGWITYANEMKTSQVGVPAELIAQHGAVSESVARAMAAGAAERSGADLAVGITGVAGPGGGSAEKPVGTVWIGLAWRQDGAGQGGEIHTEARLFVLPGGRDDVRDRAAKCAMQMLRLHVLGVSLDELRWGRAATRVA